jgi:hypothetical protein
VTPRWVTYIGSVVIGVTLTVLGGCVVGFLLLGASPFRVRLWAGPLRALPFIVAPLWPASLLPSIVLNVWPHPTASSIVLRQPLLFLGAALSGWVLLKKLTTEPIVVAGGGQRRVKPPPRLGPQLVLSTHLG